MLAHKIMIYLLGAQVDHFQAGIVDESLKGLLGDFVAIWKEDDHSPESDVSTG